MRDSAYYDPFLSAKVAKRPILDLSELEKKTKPSSKSASGYKKACLLAKACG
jgi:hypothetical protein